MPYRAQKIQPAGPVWHGPQERDAEEEEEEGAVRMLGLDPGEAATNGVDGELGRRQRVGTVEAEEEVEVIMAEAVEEAGIPVEGSRDEGMTDVVVAIMEGTLAVLLGLTPEDGGESEEKDGAAVIGEEGREVKAGVELEGVVFGGVVGEERGGEGGVTVGKRQRKEVGFGRVEVAATRVGAEGPGGEAGGLPSEQREGVVEEVGEGGTGDRVRWGRKRREKRVVERGQGLRGVAGERACTIKGLPCPCHAMPGTAQSKIGHRPC